MHVELNAARVERLGLLALLDAGWVFKVWCM